MQNKDTPKHWDKKIYLVRHGETDYNKQNIIQGRGVNSSLNETGQWQAQAFHNAYKTIYFQHVFSSTLLRTQQTLQPFTNAGYVATAYEELDEINWGEHEGKTPSSSLSTEYASLTSAWRSGKLDLKIPGGESPLELQQRQLKFLNNILAPLSGNILICSHGRAIRCLLCTLLNVDLSLMDDFPHNNLSLYILGANTGSNFEMIEFNNLDHLKNS